MAYTSLNTHDLASFDFLVGVKIFRTRDAMAKKFAIRPRCNAAGTVVPEDTATVAKCFFICLKYIGWG